MVLERRVGYATGVFDLFHVGHLRLLKRARELCDHLIVGVTDDDVVESYKARRPIVPLAERMEIVRAVRFVDEVLVQHHLDKALAWESLRFDMIFVGDDWRGSERWQKYERELAERGARVEYLPYTAETSSTALRRALELLDESAEEIRLRGGAGRTEVSPGD